MPVFIVYFVKNNFTAFGGVYCALWSIYCAFGSVYCFCGVVILCVFCWGPYGFSAVGVCRLLLFGCRLRFGGFRLLFCGSSHCAFSFLWSGDCVGSGQGMLEFGSLDDAFDFYRKYANSEGFSVRKGWERKYDKRNKKCGTVFYRQFLCNKQGFKSKPKEGVAQGKYKRANVRTGCMAEIRLILNEAKGVYEVTYWVKEHNHVLYPPAFRHMLKSNRRVSEVQGLVAKMNADCGISLRSTYEVMAMASGGRETLGFLRSDIKNHLGRKRERDMLHGEATAMYDYFKEEQRKDSNFFWEVELDCEEKVANMFWADSRMRLDYACFGDAISFDTTFGTNNLYRPLGACRSFFNQYFCVFSVSSKKQQSIPTKQLSRPPTEAI